SIGSSQPSLPPYRLKPDGPCPPGASLAFFSILFFPIICLLLKEVITMAPSSTRRCRPRFAERVRRYMSIRGGWRLVSPHVLGSVLERLERRKEERQSSTTAGVDSRVWILDLDHGGEMDFVLVEPHRAQP